MRWARCVSVVAYMVWWQFVLCCGCVDIVSVSGMCNELGVVFGLDVSVMI